VVQASAFACASKPDKKGTIDNFVPLMLSI